MGVALSACTVPAAGKPSFELGPGEIEMGLGIHGEPGVRRAPLETADATTDRLLTAIANDLRLARGDRIAVLVNNLGGTTQMELAIVARRAVQGLEGAGIIVERVYLGTFLSALEMAGVSLSAMRVDDSRLARLDAPTDAPAWPNVKAVARERTRPPTPAFYEDLTPTSNYRLPSVALSARGQAIEDALSAVTTALFDAAPRLNELDRAVGDGDLGISLERGAKALRDNLAGLPLDDPPAFLHALGLILQKAMGGTSGPLYAVLCLRAAAKLKRASSETPKTWAEAFRAGCDGVIELGGAGRGDRTMLDALLPACDAVFEAADAGSPVADVLCAAADAAEFGATETSEMLPRRGRSSYLGDRALGHPDPGASAVAVWLRALANAAVKSS
jgi:dihydroxyacetone kinase